MKNNKKQKQKKLLIVTPIIVLLLVGIIGLLQFNNSSSPSTNMNEKNKPTEQVEFQTINPEPAESDVKIEVMPVPPDLEVKTKLLS